MKYTNLRAFEKHLESAAPDHLAGLYVVLSKEDFPRKIGCDRVVGAFKKKHPDISVHFFEGGAHSAEEIIAELNTRSLFARNKIVILGSCDKLSKQGMNLVENYFANPNPYSILLLSAATLNRATNFYKKAEKSGIILDIPEEKPWEKEKNLAEWLIIEAMAQRKKLDPKTAEFMIKRIGLDQALLHQELKKLCCYIGAKDTIGISDVSHICLDNNGENAWQLGEAIFRREAPSALRISKSLLAEGEALILLLRQLRSQFQTELHVCDILSRGGGAQEVAQKFPYMKGRVLERHMEMARNYGKNHLVEGILCIDETELKSKNGTIDPELLLELLIVKLTSQR